MLSSTFDARYKQVGATRRGSYSVMLFLHTESKANSQFQNIYHSELSIGLLVNAVNENITNSKKEYFNHQLEEEDS